MMCFKHAIFPFSCHNALLCVCQFYITDYNDGSRLGAYCKLKNCSFQIFSRKRNLKMGVVDGLFDSSYQLSRPDTQLPQSRTVGQGQW